MEYIENGKLEIVEQIKNENNKEIEKPILPDGTIVYCRGTEGAGSFYGIVYKKGVLELENGSEVYIYTNKYIHLGDKINYWVIEKVVKAKLIIEDVIAENKSLCTAGVYAKSIGIERKRIKQCLQNG